MHVLINEVINDIPSVIECVLSVFALNLQFVMHIKVAPRVHTYLWYLYVSSFSAQVSNYKVQLRLKIDAENIDLKNKWRV